mgnify:FL=1
MRAQYRTLFLINEQGGGRIGYECNLLEHLVTFFMYGLCVYYDRCNQDDYSTKSDKNADRIDGQHFQYLSEGLFLCRFK